MLTYVPEQPDGFQVQMGNIGQHYYDWRYKETRPPPRPRPPLRSRPTPVPGPSDHQIHAIAVDLIGDTSAATLDKVKSIGVGAVRLQLAWSTIEPQEVAPAQYNWASLDAIYKALSDQGLQPITLVEGCPVWACTRPSGPMREEHVADFVEFMAAMSARYSKAPYNAHVWELWNEPDSGGRCGARHRTSTTAGEQRRPLRSDAQSDQARRERGRPAAMLVLGGMAYDGFLENGAHSTAVSSTICWQRAGGNTSTRSTSTTTRTTSTGAA